ncbi:MAG: cell division protein ZapA [Dysgonamonadaceae bacterium]
MDEHFIITLNVNGRSFPLRIRRDREEVYRKAVKELDRKTNQYKSLFQKPYAETMSRRKIDEMDCVLMTAIQAVSENIRLEKETDAKEMEKRLRSMIQEVDNYLNQ